MNHLTDLPSARRTVGLCLAAMALTLPLAACGGDDGESSDTTVAASSGSDAGSQGDAATDAEADAAAEEMTTDAVTGEGSSMGLDLETRAEAIGSVIDFDDYSIDGSTLTIVFDDGSKDSDAIVVCTAANGVLDEGETVVVEYPDGSTTC